VEIGDMSKKSRIGGDTLGLVDRFVGADKYHTIPYHTIPYHTIPYHTIPEFPECPEFPEYPEFPEFP
jgi:hypothetical protein